MKPFRSIVPLLLLMVLAGPSAFAGNAERDLRKDLRSKDEGRRLEAVAELAESGRRDAASLIGGRLRDSSPKVRAAAAEALGRIADRTAVGKLLAAIKPLKDDPQTLAAICRALGKTGSTAAVERLAGLAKREMSRNAELTKAAVAGLGGIRDRSSIDELIGLLGTATPTSSARTYSYGHPELIAPIRSALQRLTGQQLRAHPAWAEWWRRVKRAYRFPEDPGAALAAKVYRDEGYLFRLERPSKTRWEFSQGKGVILEVRFRGGREEATHGVVQVMVHRAQNVSASTPEDLADRYADRFEGEFKDIKELEDGRDRLGGRPAIRQRLIGMTRRGLVVELRQWIALYRGNLYTVRATISSGAGAKVREELDGILASFRFLSS